MSEWSPLSSDISRGKFVTGMELGIESEDKGKGKRKLKSWLYNVPIKSCECSKTNDRVKK